MTKIKLTSKKRDVFGRKVKKLREKGEIPANIFGKKVKSQAITVDSSEFEKVFEEAGETQIIDLSGKPVLVSNVSYDPVSDDLLHVDFRQVDLTEKITAQVPVEIKGESPAEKQGLGTVVVQVNEIEVEALPTELPEEIVVDISSLEEVDQAIYVKDMKVSSKATIKEEDPEAIVVKVEPLREEEPEPVVEEEVTEGEVPEGEESAEQKTEAEEGQAPSENQEKGGQDQKEAPQQPSDKK